MITWDVLVLLGMAATVLHGLANGAKTSTHKALWHAPPANLPGRKIVTPMNGTEK